MKFSKPLTAAAVAAGLVVGGAGVVSAGEDRDASVDETETGLQVQLEDDATVEDDTDADTEDGERNNRRGRRGARLSSVAEVLGVESDDLRTELQDGATIADVAEDNGVAVQDVIDALIANVEERLDAKVEAGDLTEDEAAEKLDSKTERITDKVNGVETERTGDNVRGDRGADAADETTDA